MCYYSQLIKNPKYTPNKKNGGVVPYMEDKRVAVVPIGCGECKECRKAKQREWQVRLKEDIKHNTNMLDKVELHKGDQKIAVENMEKLTDAILS